jgi:hypothetical protein
MSRDRQGRTIIEEWGMLGAPDQGDRRQHVRLITLCRPNAEDIIVTTNLLDRKTYSATDILDVYLTRWEIENVFQNITEVFELRHLIGSTPQATVFQTSLSLLIANLLQVAKYYIAEAQPKPTKVADLSTEMIFESIKDQLSGLHELLTAKELVKCLPRPKSLEEVKERLQELMSGQWSTRWKKVRNKKPRPAKIKRKKSGAHTSVYKEQQKTKKDRSKKSSATTR